MPVEDGQSAGVLFPSARVRPWGMSPCMGGWGLGEVPAPEPPFKLTATRKRAVSKLCPCLGLAWAWPNVQNSTGASLVAEADRDSLRAVRGGREEAAWGAARIANRWGRSDSAETCDK